MFSRISGNLCENHEKFFKPSCSCSLFVYIFFNLSLILDTLIGSLSVNLIVLFQTISMLFYSLNSLCHQIIQYTVIEIRRLENFAGSCLKLNKFLTRNRNFFKTTQQQQLKHLFIPKKEIKED